MWKACLFIHNYIFTCPAPPVNIHLTLTWACEGAMPICTIGNSNPEPASFKILWPLKKCGKYLQLICKQSAVNNHFNDEDFFPIATTFRCFSNCCVLLKKKKAAEDELHVFMLEKVTPVQMYWVSILYSARNSSDCIRDICDIRCKTSWLSKYVPNWTSSNK